MKKLDAPQTPHDQLKYEFRMGDMCDGWGSCMGWMFALADYITFNLDDCVPDEWEFSPSSMGANDESPEFETLKELKPTIEDCEKFGAMLWRYRAKLIVAGKDY